MINSPRALFDFYLSRLMAGQVLTFDQLIKFEYLKTLYIVSEDVSGEE